MKKVILVCMLLLFVVMYGNTFPESQYFVVGGDADKFYPVQFQEVNREYGITEFEISRNEIEMQDGVPGSLIANFKAYSKFNDDTRTFMDVDIKHNIQEFVGGWHRAEATEGIILYLRGGDTKYRFKGIDSDILPPTVYIGVANETAQGRTGSYYVMNNVQSYVNSDGETLSDNLNIDNNLTVKGITNLNTLHLNTLDVDNNVTVNGVLEVGELKLGGVSIMPYFNDMETRIDNLEENSNLNPLVEENGKVLIGKKSLSTNAYNSTISTALEVKTDKKYSNSSVMVSAIHDYGENTLEMIAFGNSLGVGFFSKTWSDMSFWTSGTKLLTLKKNQKVLIGTTDDDEINRLQVNGSGKFQSRVVCESPGTVGNTYFTLNDSNEVEKGYVGYRYATTDNFYIKNKKNADLILATNDKDSLSIKANGNVLIGTPEIYKTNGKLQVNGDTYVDGTLFAEELIVELSSNWPDYVFGDDYKLRSLKEVEEFVKENKHLPGVPAESEIYKNGLSINEMLKIQMEKIEELTLYVIEKDKNEKKLNKKMEKLEEENKKMQEKIEKIMKMFNIEE